MAARALYLRNGNVLGHKNVAASVLVHEGRIVAVGDDEELREDARAARADDLDLRGLALLPGFIDTHIHLLGYAARLISVDCGPPAVTSIAELKDAIWRAASSVPPGAWIRAVGYDEVALVERRHPTRHDLDAAAPANPVRLTHRGGHAVVLNSAALALAGISTSTPEPPGGHMDRDLETGEPTGLLVEMNELVERAVPPLSVLDLRQAVERAERRLIAAGITCIQDATPTNGGDEWRLFARLQAEGALRLSVSTMEGVEHMGELPEGSGRLRRGPVKLMPAELEHHFYPPAAELAALVQRIDALGRSAAVHVVTRQGLDAVLNAFQTARVRARAGRHRLEHCGVCSPEQAARIARLGLTVVTQPAFIHQNGSLMLRRLAEGDLADLYPLRRLIDAGVSVAGSSDAPVSEPDVISGVRGAVERRSLAGDDMGAAQALAPAEALALFTSAAAGAIGQETERGKIEPGLAADFVVLNQDPVAADVDWDSMSVEMTILDGEILYERASAADRSPGSL